MTTMVIIMAMTALIFFPAKSLAASVTLQSIGRVDTLLQQLHQDPALTQLLLQKLLSNALVAP